MFFPVGDAACLIHVHHRIHQHFRVDTQIPEPGLGDQRAQGVGHTSDSQLDAGTIRNFPDQMICDDFLSIIGRCRDRGKNRGIVRFHNQGFIT